MLTKTKAEQLVSERWGPFPDGILVPLGNVVARGDVVVPDWNKEPAWAFKAVTQHGPLVYVAHGGRRGNINLNAYWDGREDDTWRWISELELLSRVLSEPTGEWQTQEAAIQALEANAAYEHSEAQLERCGPVQAVRTRGIYGWTFKQGAVHYVVWWRAKGTYKMYVHKSDTLDRVSWLQLSGVEILAREWANG
jgi:hypothetical protein